MDWLAEFSSKIKQKKITVGIIGLGYVGLPTAIGFHDAGFTVGGVDVSHRTSGPDFARKESNWRP